MQFGKICFVISNLIGEKALKSYESSEEVKKEIDYV